MKTLDNIMRIVGLKKYPDKQEQTLFNKQDAGSPWQYTDDIVAVIIVLAWIGGKITAKYEIPDPVVALILGWVFRKNVID